LADDGRVVDEFGQFGFEPLKERLRGGGA